MATVIYDERRMPLARVRRRQHHHFPVLTPERWMGDLAKTPVRDEVKPGLFKHNAARLLGLR